MGTGTSKIVQVNYHNAGLLLKKDRVAKMIVFLLSLLCHALVPIMKSSELHRKIKKNGWVHIRTEGSHYIYQKGGSIYPVPFHGAKETPKGTEKKTIKEMGLKL
jgi:mRNA interferase HicA